MVTRVNRSPLDAHSELPGNQAGTPPSAEAAGPVTSMADTGGACQTGRLDGSPRFRMGLGDDLFLATAAGTLVLAIATFSAVRSSNRSARIAEVALQEQRRPLLAPSRLEDPKQTIMFLEGNWVRRLRWARRS